MLYQSRRIRLQRLKDDKLEAALAEDDQNGFTMVRPLVAQLPKFEKSEPSMSLYFPDLINGIDVPAEQKRLANFVFKSDAELAGGTKAKPARPIPEPNSTVGSSTVTDRLP